jgi:hypothetical protein
VGRPTELTGFTASLTRCTYSMALRVKHEHDWGVSIHETGRVLARRIRTKYAEGVDWGYDSTMIRLSLCLVRRKARFAGKATGLVAANHITQVIPLTEH